MDQLSEAAGLIDFNTEVFFSGQLCGLQSIGDNSCGHLHVLKSGTLNIVTEDGHKIFLDRPSVIFIPSKSNHRLSVGDSENAELVCAKIHFGQGQEKFVNSLPRFIYFDGASHQHLQRAANWLFEEAFQETPGKQMMLDKLSDIIFIQILRHITEKGLVVHGILSALVHPQLSKLIAAIQKAPSDNWNLDTMAATASMSRSKFATLFKDTVGKTPNEYLTEIRLVKAQELLINNKPVSMVAHEVGYEHASALSRVFRKRYGISPKEWLKEKLSA